MFFFDRLPYNDYAGGVVALREDVYVKSNGFSNIYFGWGGEDDDFLHRYVNCYTKPQK